MALRLSLLILSSALILALWTLPLLAVDDYPISKSRRSGVAIGGVDPLSYHDSQAIQQHQAVMGSDRYTVAWGGAVWRFASPQSRDRFAADPTAYLPRYGGHCANALALGEGLIGTNGQVWEFFGDELFLFYAERGRQRWLKGDWQSYRQEADSAWQRITAARP